MALTNSERKKDRLYLKEYGEKICDNGYLVLPCRAEKKRPAMKGWSGIHADKSQIVEWLEDSYYKRDGVSLLTGAGKEKVVAVDIDVRDEDMAERITQYVQQTFGFAPLRMGNKPKVLFMFRTDEQFGKLRTATYIDPLEDEEHAVEILAHGQQFVAYSVHPDTGKPYVWHKDYGSPKDTKADDLPTLTHAECKDIIIHASELFEDEGWEVKPKSKPMGLTRDAIHSEPVEDLEGDLSDVERKDPISGIDVDEAREVLSHISDQADAGYDAWLAVGSALHHQFQGDGDGLELWDEWSQSSSDYDRDELEAKWDSFDSKHKDARTFASVIHDAKEAGYKGDVLSKNDADRKWQLASDIKADIAICEDAQELHDELVVRVGEEFNETSPHFDDLVDAVITRSKALGKPIKRPSLVKTLKKHANEAKRETHEALQADTPENRRKIEKRFPWVKGVYWREDTDTYVSSYSASISRESFKTMHQFNLSNMPDDERMKYVAREQDIGKFDDVVWFMRVVARIPTVYSTGLGPGEDQVFTKEGRDYFNTFEDFRERVVAEEFEWDEKQTEAVEAFKDVVRIASGGGEREFNLLMSWIAYRYENPGKKNNWGVYLHGPKGSGKSTLLSILRGVFLPSNVVSVSTEERRSAFNPSSAKAMFALLDEADFKDHRTKTSVSISLRADITGDVIPVIAKGADSVEKPNYQDWMLAANVLDGILFDEDDRRWMVVSSALETAEAARKYWTEDKTPSGETRGDRVQTLLRDPECLAALRGYLQDFDWRSVEEYTPARAPQTSAKGSAAEESLSGLASEVKTVMDEGCHWWAQPHLVCVTRMKAYLLAKDRVHPNDVRSKQIFRKILQDQPFNLMQKAVINRSTKPQDGKVTIYYNKSYISEEEVKALVKDKRGDDDDPLSDYDDFR